MAARIARRTLSVLALGALVGCAPAVFAPAGLSFGTSSGSWSSFSQCSPLDPSPQATRMGIHSPLVRATAMQRLAYQLQSRFLSFQSGIGRLEGYRGIAAGDC